MTDSLCCSRCGCELPVGTPEEQCPACLLEAGLAADTPSQEMNPPAADDPRLAATTPLGQRFVPPAVEELAPLFPQLELLQLVGHGGMGAVYQARQKKLDRLVALKIIRPEDSADPAFAERFMREARTLARLAHPGIVAVHDFGEVTPDSQAGPHLYYFVMEFVEGDNLRQLMEGGLPPSDALAIVPQVCEALQFAHDEGVIHRDIKPENILVDRKGRVKIADFGLARLTTRSPEEFTLTATHQVMGTPRYMAPEQMAAAREIDHRADIYSLGVMLYEMLTGDVPMGQFALPSQKAGVDVRLDDVVLRALAREPERRFQHASDMKASVDRISSDVLPPAPGRQMREPFPAGPSTVLEREVIGAWRWVAGEAAPGLRVDRPYPVLLSLTLAVAGCLMLLLPWYDVLLAEQQSDEDSRVDQAAQAVAMIVDSAVVERHGSLLPVATGRIRASVATSGAPVFQTTGYGIQARDGGSGFQSPPASVDGLPVTFRGIDLMSGMTVAIVFAVMTLFILMCPDRWRRSAFWNLIVLLLGITTLVATLVSAPELSHSRIRLSAAARTPTGPSGHIGLSESNGGHGSPVTVQPCYFQEAESRIGSSRRGGAGSTARVVYLSEAEHTVVRRAGFWGSFSLSVAMVILSASGIRNALSVPRSSRPFESSVIGRLPRPIEVSGDSRANRISVPARVRLDVSGPSLALFLAGFLMVVCHGIGCCVMMLDRTADEVAWMLIPGIASGMLMMIGGLHLRNLWSRCWAQVGAIAGMIPLSPGALLTFLAGCWAWRTISQPAVTEVFLQSEERRQSR